MKVRRFRHILKAVNGATSSESKGYDAWQDAAVSQTEDGSKAILANPVMINARKEGIPGNGKPFPKASMIVKVEWTRKTNPVPLFADGAGHSEISFVHRERFQQIPGHGWWGYAQFLYTAVTAWDFIFTDWPKR